MISINCVPFIALTKKRLYQKTATSNLNGPNIEFIILYTMCEYELFILAHLD